MSPVRVTEKSRRGLRSQQMVSGRYSLPPTTRPPHPSSAAVQVLRSEWGHASLCPKLTGSLSGIGNLFDPLSRGLGTQVGHRTLFHPAPHLGICLATSGSLHAASDFRPGAGLLPCVPGEALEPGDTKLGCGPSPVSQHSSRPALAVQGPSVVTTAYPALACTSHHSFPKSLDRKVTLSP